MTSGQAATSFCKLLTTAFGMVRHFRLRLMPQPGCVEYFKNLELQPHADSLCINDAEVVLALFQRFLECLPDLLFPGSLHRRRNVQLWHLTVLAVSSTYSSG